MRMGVMIVNTKTGEIKEIKVGWSWILFWFSGLFGLPLFLRRLYVWGAIFLSLWVVNLVGPSLASGFDRTSMIGTLFLVGLGLSIFMAIKGNEMTAKNYLENGWVFVTPDGEITQIAQARWGISAGSRQMPSGATTVPVQFVGFHGAQRPSASRTLVWGLFCRICLPGPDLTLRISLDKRPAFGYLKVDEWAGAPKPG